MIVKEMNRVAADHNARFVLVTRVVPLYETSIAVDIPSFDVSAALANERFALNPTLGHMNEPGNGVLAWKLAASLHSMCSCRRSTGEIGRPCGHEHPVTSS